MRAPWPDRTVRFVDLEAEEAFGQVMTIVEEVRGHRQAAGAPPRGGKPAPRPAIDRDRGDAGRTARMGRAGQTRWTQGTPLASAPGRVSFPAGASDSRQRREAYAERAREVRPREDRGQARPTRTSGQGAARDRQEAGGPRGRASRGHRPPELSRGMPSLALLAPVLLLPHRRRWSDRRFRARAAFEPGRAIAGAGAWAAVLALLGASGCRCAPPRS